MATERWYLWPTDLDTTCAVTDSGAGTFDHDLRNATPGGSPAPYSQLSDSTSSGAYDVVMVYDYPISNMIGGTYEVSVQISAISGTSNVRWKLQAIDSSGCTADDESSYSTVYTTTGVKTDSLSLTPVRSTSDRLRLVIEVQFTGGKGSGAVEIYSEDTDSFIDVPILTGRRAIVIGDV